jgi:hypothetical protein
MQILIDLVRAVKGLIRLFRFDASYAGYFDKSIQATWRSFFAMMLLAPMVLLDFPDDLTATYPNVSEFRFLAVEVLTYIIGWFAVPLAVLELGRWLKRSDAMPAFITVYNWFQLIHLPFVIAIWLAFNGGFDAVGGIIALLSLAAYFTYLFYLSRSFLNLEMYAAASIVAADLAISLLLEEARVLALS